MYYLTRYGFMVINPSIEQIQLCSRMLRFKPEMKVGYVNVPSFDVFILHENKLFVPRIWGIKYFGNFVCKIPDGCDIEDGVVLRDDFRLDSSRSQDLAAKAIEENLELSIENGGGVGQVCLPCGAGKTVLFIYIIFRILRKVAAIVVHTNQLADQWEERIRYFCPNAKIGRVQGSTIITQDCDVIICMLKTVAMKENLPPDLFARVGVMIIDECHLVSTHAFSQMLSRWCVRRVYGLSATPHRKDKMDAILECHIGGQIYTGTREKVPVSVKLCYTDVSSLQELTNKKTQKVDQVAMISQLVQDIRRTELIADVVIKFHSSKVLLLSERRSHLEDIQTAILAKQPGLSDNVGLYMGKMSKADLKHSESCLIILGTYTIASVGLDIRGLNTLILASPRSDVVQASGRIQRDMTPSFDKTIVDICDRFSVFKAQIFKRTKFYKDSGFTIGTLNL